MRKPNRLGTAGGKLTAVLGTATLTSAVGGPASAMRFVTRRRPGPVLLGLAVTAAAAVAVPASASAAERFSGAPTHNSPDPGWPRTDHA
jgi:hypothetical protein